MKGYSEALEADSAPRQVHEAIPLRVQTAKRTFGQSLGGRGTAEHLSSVFAEIEGCRRVLLGDLESS